MHELDFNPDGMRWIDANDNDNSVLIYMRYGKDSDNPLVIALQLHAGAAPRLSHRSPQARQVARSARTATPQSTEAPTKATTAAPKANRFPTTALSSRS